MIPELWSTQQTQFFVILGDFLPFYPTNLRNQNFEKLKKNTWRYHHFTQVYKKIIIICHTVPDIWH